MKLGVFHLDPRALKLAIFQHKKNSRKCASTSNGIFINNIHYDRWIRQNLLFLHLPIWMSSAMQMCFADRKQHATVKQ